jgi:hypothetical protein
MIDVNYAPTLTVERFAALPMCWPDTIRVGQVTYDQRDIRRDYAELLRIVLTLPVIELSHDQT